MAEGQKRITPEMVIEAYEKTGMKAAQNCFYDYTKGRVVGDKVLPDCACGIGALYAQTKPEILRGREAREYAEEIYSKEYTLGFMDGFDTLFIDRPPLDSNLDYLMGYHDGTKAWAAAKKERLAV